MNKNTRNGLRILAVGFSIFLVYVVHQELSAFYRTGENPSIVGDQVTLLTLGKTDSPLGKYAWSYDEAQITGRYVLTPDEVARLRSEFANLNWKNYGMAACHDPGFVIKGSRFFFPTDDISVCFHCNNVEIGGFFMRHQMDFLTPSSKGLREVLTSLTKR